MSILSILLFLPLIGSAIIALSPKKVEKYASWFTLIISLIGLIIALYIAMDFDKATASYQFLEQLDWITVSLGSIGTLSIDYILGVDGISMPLVVLAAIIQVIGAISSFEIQTKVKGYFSTYLLLSGSVMGCFLALDFFLFFLFFEFMLLPMYFLIGIWGGKNKEFASIKFFIYTLIGSIFILVVMIGIYLSAVDPVSTAQSIGLVQNINLISPEIIGTVQDLIAKGEIPTENIVHTFDFRFLSDTANYLPNSILSLVQENNIGGINVRNLAFLLLFVGFAIKLPLVPFHTWLPDAHVEAPTAISVVLAGTLLKIGGYGFIRIAYSIFPDSAVHYAYWIGIAGIFSIIWGAYNSLSQTDFKRQIAFSSVSHMGFVVIGIASLTAEGVNGAIFQMFSHGILSAMLFLIVGVLYYRTGNRQISDFQGIANKMPAFTVFVVIAFFASLGLPAFSGFIGEFFSLMGAFNSSHFPKYFTALAAFGIVIGASYFLWTFKRIFLGNFWIKNEAILMTDLKYYEWIMFVILAIVTLSIGIMPNLIFDISADSVKEFLKLF
ncbi:MAG: NADH-quinone oxidoreductase subunit M [Bacteroidota bacterium]